MNPGQLAKNIFIILVIGGICIERYLLFQMSRAKINCVFVRTEVKGAVHSRCEHRS